MCTGRKGAATLCGLWRTRRGAGASAGQNHRLEGELQSELDEACVRCVVLEAARQGNLTTLRRIVVDAGRCPAIVKVAVGVGVRRRVEQVENIRSELQRHFLAHFEVLEHGQVDPLVSRTVNLVADAAQIRLRGRSRHCTAAKGAPRQRISESARVVPVGSVPYGSRTGYPRVARRRYA